MQKQINILGYIIPLRFVLKLRINQFQNKNKWLLLKCFIIIKCDTRKTFFDYLTLYCFERSLQMNQTTYFLWFKFQYCPAVVNFILKFSHSHYNT